MVGVGALVVLPLHPGHVRENRDDEADDYYESARQLVPRRRLAKPEAADQHRKRRHDKQGQALQSVRSSAGRARKDH